MTKPYKIKKTLGLLIILIAFGSCHKSVTPTPVTPNNGTPVKLGLIEEKGTDASYKGYSLYQSLIPILTIGTNKYNSAVTFDTGSGGLVIDGSELVPASLITSSGFNFTGDSTIVNGITITNRTNTISYGPVSATADKVYGNLAYAQVTIGDNNGSLVVSRLPFFIYYKAVDQYGNNYDQGTFDIFGSSEIYDLTFSNGIKLTSPFSYCTPGTGLTKGFKMAAVDGSNFTTTGNYVSGALTFGLTSSDLSATSGFVLTPIGLSDKGYYPYVLSSLTYNSTKFTTYVLFDSGTNYCNFIEDPKYSGASEQLNPNTTVNIISNSGFNYNFSVTTSSNLTFILAPEQKNFSQSIMGIEYFFKNEYLLDLTNHQIGLKNN